MRKDSDKIRGMFNDIAPKYDFLNHLLSLGIDKSWRRKIVKAVSQHSPLELLDVATGTGDLALALARRNKNCHIIGADLSPNMLRVGVQKVEKKGLSSQIEFKECSALALPFTTEQFDVVTASFGVRNFEDLPLGLSEMMRVVKKGGYVYVLEFSKPQNSLISAPYLFYFKHILPLIGRMVSKSENAYSYLPNSVVTFPCGDEFVSIMQQIGLKNCSAKALSFGIATMYVGQK